MGSGRWRGSVGLPSRSQLGVENDDEAGHLLKCLLGRVPQMQNVIGRELAQMLPYSTPVTIGTYGYHCALSFCVGGLGSRRP
jgi:hypothetical protein